MSVNRVNPEVIGRWSNRRLRPTSEVGPSAAAARYALMFEAEIANLALQLPFMQVSESMGNHDSKIVDAASVD
jgi:hypothetical protein